MEFQDSKKRVRLDGSVEVWLEGRFPAAAVSRNIEGIW